MKLEINKLKPNKNNPRVIKDDKFKKLVKSIKEFPEMLELRPIVVDEDMTILGGNMRHKACIKAGLKEVYIKIAKGLTDKQKEEFIVKDNVGFGEWEWDILANQWDSVQLTEWGLDVWENEDDKVTEGLIDDDEIPEAKESRVVLGDIWKLGNHRIMCGDSTSSDDVAKLMNGEKADMVFTDPPYNVNIGSIKHSKFKQREIQNDNMSSQDFKIFVKGFVKNIKLFCDGIVYCWSGQGKDGRIMFTVLDENLHNSTTIIWNKDQFTLGRGKYQNKYEPCWFGWVNSGKTFTDNRTLTNVWDFKRPKKSELHPTMKPLELCENALNHSSQKNDIILDLFLGSGSTLIAAEKLNRKCYGMELDEKYCDVIIERWEQFTGKKAEKIN